MSNLPSEDGVYIEKITKRNLKHSIIHQCKTFKQGFKWLDDNGYLYTGVSNLYTKGRSTVCIYAIVHEGANV